MYVHAVASFYSIYDSMYIPYSTVLGRATVIHPILCRSPCHGQSELITPRVRNVFRSDLKRQVITGVAFIYSSPS